MTWFLAACGLPGRWRARSSFTILDTSFGVGDAFVAAWQAWRDDPARSDRLTYVGVAPHPPGRDEVRAAHPGHGELADAWPPRTPDLHTLTFDGGRVRLLLAFGAGWLTDLEAQADALFLHDLGPADGLERLVKAAARHGFEGAVLAADSADDRVRHTLRSLGFVVEDTAQPGTTRAVYAPHFKPRTTSPQHARMSTDRHALIVGAGLAGCATAWALAGHGWRSTLLERHSLPAGGASGNPAGIFHGIVNAADGNHARFNRAAALRLASVMRQALAEGAIGELAGLLRLEADLDPAGMDAVLARLGLPTDYVQALDRETASARAGLALQQPAWYFPQGGWVAPATLCGHYLRHSGPAVELKTGAGVHSLVRDDGGWNLLDRSGRSLGQGHTVVLANAQDAWRLAGEPPWPVRQVRGQLSVAAAVPGSSRLRLPVAGRGYVIPGPGDAITFGATAQVGDLDALPRDSDRASNLENLHRLLGPVEGVDLTSCIGRVAWRFVADDRLPLVGAVPEATFQPGLTRMRQVARQPGLYIHAALGSRGIAWSALGAEVLAASIAGAPAPVGTRLLDAIDPARFQVRKSRRQGAVDPLPAGTA